MLKVSLIIDCDGCRLLFPFSPFVSDDISAWQLHAGTLTEMAQEHGWETSDCGNFHYCSSCYDELLEMQKASQI
jgi:hypothetical protein